MCGIVGGVSNRDVAPILLEGLHRLEYRGYDSAGIAIVNAENHIQRQRRVGKVVELQNALNAVPIGGGLGVAHTRWATHGAVTQDNAHPHMSHEEIALVHNGIIENHDSFREMLLEKGYQFESETDTEVVAHLLHYHLQQGKSLLEAVKSLSREFQGAFSLGIISRQEPNRLIGVQKGCPLVVGVGEQEHFIASDHIALLPVTQQFVFLEEGDVVDLSPEKYDVYDLKGDRVNRVAQKSQLHVTSLDRGKYRHHMIKEIFEQPHVVSETLDGRIAPQHVLERSLGEKAHSLIAEAAHVQIVACGTSYHAGLVGKYWMEALGGISTQVEIASEIRYRKTVVGPNTLFVSISQSGETADTLAALRASKSYLGSIAVCNSPESSLVRGSDCALITRAGPEIGVASTKAFTTQLVALMLLAVLFGRRRGLSADQEAEIVQELRALPKMLEQVLQLNDTIQQLAERFSDKQHALFLGRGVHYPLALEGALKLKEISYIHAEGYPAGELKHGPLALVDKNMPVIVVAPNDALLEKLKSNMQEVRARGGELIVFADAAAKFEQSPGVTIIPMPVASQYVTPILYTLPLQLLAYHVAVLKGTDIDQPRNLAKSVTVE